MTAKEHYDAIATIHRDSGNSVTRAESAKSGISIYVVSDPELKRLFESLCQVFLDRMYFEGCHREQERG